MPTFGLNQQKKKRKKSALRETVTTAKWYENSGEMEMYFFSLLDSFILLWNTLLCAYISLAVCVWGNICNVGLSTALKRLCSLFQFSEYFITKIQFVAIILLLFRWLLHSSVWRCSCYRPIVPSSSSWSSSLSSSSLPLTPNEIFWIVYSISLLQIFHMKNSSAIFLFDWNATR